MARRPGAVVTQGPAPGRHKEHACGHPSEEVSTCARSFSCWLLSWCSYQSRERISPTRSEPWTEAETTATIRHGERRTRSTCGSPGELRRRDAKPVGGPPTRYVSNRIFNDVNQNVFSERGVTQWGCVWGQFLDHTFGLRDEAGEPQRRTSRSTATDPLETFTNNLGLIPFTRTPAAPGTGIGNAAAADQHGSSLHRRAAAVYGGTDPGWTGCARDRWTATSPTTAPG